MWFMGYPGWFHWWPLLGYCVALHFAGRHLGRHLLKSSGREGAAPFCRMAPRVPQGFTGKWSGSGMEHTWDVLGLHCCTAGQVSELVEGVDASAAHVRSATGLITLKWLVLHYVNFTLVHLLKKKILTVPGLKPRYTISLSTLQKSY